METIFAEQPYLANVYPGTTREIGVVFAIREAVIEYFNLGVNPIFRESYTLGGGKAAPRGYVITGNCVGCGACLTACPQSCIAVGTPYQIDPRHCLHCGNCVEHCPAQAIKVLE